MDLHVTHLGTATLLLELAGLTILTDPVLGGPCSRDFGFGMRSRHLRGPYVDVGSLPPIDLALISHDQHADNLDAEGSALVARASTVITTVAASRRLACAGGRAIGLRPFASHRVGPLTITATPARHGPPLSRPFVGPVIGFVIEGAGEPLYISGDTVYFGGVEEVARRWSIGVAFLHLGGAGHLGLRFTMDAREGVRAARVLGARRVVPIHYDDWTHFKDPADGIGPAFRAAGLADRLVQLPKGRRVALFDDTDDQIRGGYG